MSYKECKTAAELNAYTDKERISRCGYLDTHWNQSGSYASTEKGFKDNFKHTRQNTCRDAESLSGVLTGGQVAILRNEWCEELQLSNVLKEMNNAE